MLLVCGNYVHSTKDQSLVFKENAVIGVSEGKISFIEEELTVEKVKEKHGLSNEECTAQQLDENSFLMPGLIDGHIHAPQYVNSGLGLDLPLLDWLEKYTFPTEANFSDLNFAADAYRKVVLRTLKNGTTTACYFASIHLDATLILCDMVEKYGQRAYVGKVCMDCNSPPNYTETLEDTVKDTETLIQKVLNRKNPLLTPIITPRFAVTSTREAMVQLGDLYKKYNVPIQSHVSENLGEITKVKELFPEQKNYVDVYKSCGLLTPKTLLAHGVHLSDDEIQTLAEEKTGIVHCPLSNTNLRSGLCDVKRLLNNGVKTGLGTDVSGGHHSSMFESIRQTVGVANVLSMQATKQGKHYTALDYKDAFRLATLGSAEVLGLDERIGNFEVGKEFDALMVKTDVIGGPVDVFDKDTFQDKVQKFIYTGDDRNIIAVYVNGQKVVSSGQPEGPHD